MITSTALDSYAEYWRHFANLEKDDATHLYEYYRKQLQLLTYNHGKTQEFNYKHIIISFHPLLKGDTQAIPEYYAAGWVIIEYYAAIWVSYSSIIEPAG